MSGNFEVKPDVGQMTDNGSHEVTGDPYLQSHTYRAMCKELCLSSAMLIKPANQIGKYLCCLWFIKNFMIEARIDLQTFVG